MNRRFSIVATACLLLFLGGRGFSQLQTPAQPVNIIIDSDMAISADDVGDHAMMWALVNKGEVKVLAEICSSANDFSAPTMWVIANYYGHPDVPIGAHKGATPILENSATSMYTQQIRDQFGKPGDTRANYPDPVPVYRQALAGAPDHSVVIVANGFYQPLQALLQSPADSISPLTGMQLVAQKVMRLVSGAGWFPSGNEFDFRVDADAASFVIANWPVEIVSSGVQMSQDVIAGPSLTSDPTKDPVKRAYDLYNSSDRIPGFGQVSLLFGVRGQGTNFVASGFNGQTIVQNTLNPPAGQNNWFQTPNVGHSWLSKAGTAADLEAIINPLVQSSSNLPIVRSISPASVAAGSSGPVITLTGNNFFSDSQVLFNGNSRPTTVISGTQVSVQLSDSDVAQPGTQTLSVSNSSEGPWQSTPVNFTVTGSAPPAPTLSAISPTSTVAGSGPVNLTATGTNFVSTSVVQVNGTSRSTSFVSGSQLTATLTASDTATAGSLSITVTTPGSGTSAPLTFTVTNAPPSLSSISPSSATAGGPAFTLTATGSNFVNGSVVQVNGSNRTTTFVNSTQLSASIPASDIASAGTLAIGVINPDGSTSGTLPFTVNNPAPSLSSISPSSATAGGPGFTMTLTGSNFVSTSVVQVNGAGRTTNFVSATQLTAAIPASDIASAGTLSITVFNPAPGGGTSTPLVFTVTVPLPTLSSISPSTANAGGPAFTLTANGSNFVNKSVVQVNGSNRTTTFVSRTQLTAAIPASDIASTGSLTIGVINPNGSASGTLSLAVNNPQPSLASISPASATAGDPGFTLTVSGSNFVSASVVQVAGANRTTTFVSSTQLTAAIPASDLAVGALLSVTVFTPTPGGGTSSAITFTVNNPVPSISSISPSTVVVLGPSFTLTVNGSGFISGSVVQVDGSPRPTTFVSSTQLTAQISDNDILTVGQRSITVFNPTPGGGTSNSKTLTVIGLL
jgi:hypothetical protein